MNLTLFDVKKIAYSAPLSPPLPTESTEFVIPPGKVPMIPCEQYRLACREFLRRHFDVWFLFVRKCGNRSSSVLFGCLTEGEDLFLE